MAIDLPSEIAVDLRMPIVGDSYSWAGVEPAAAKKSLVFHHSASDAPSEDGFSIAEYHVNHNGWGGIGYHFVITRSDYPGRAGQTTPGAQIQYVGDLGSWRAHVLNQNNGRVGICFVGNTPDEGQLRLGRKLVDFLIAPNGLLPSINYYSQVTVHRLVPEQSTACPGDDYNNWLPYLQGGAEPFAPVPQPVVPEPEPNIITVDLAAPSVATTVLPEYQLTYKNDPSTQVTKQPAFAADMTGAGAPIPIPQGTTIDIAGSFTDNGKEYVRTVYSRDHNTWYGLPFEAFQEIPQPITGQVPDTEIPVRIEKPKGIGLAVFLANIIGAILKVLGRKK